MKKELQESKTKTCFINVDTEDTEACVERFKQEMNVTFEGLAKPLQLSNVLEMLKFYDVIADVDDQMSLEDNDILSLSGSDSIGFSKPHHSCELQIQDLRSQIKSVNSEKLLLTTDLDKA